VNLGKEDILSERQLPISWEREEVGVKKKEKVFKATSKRKKLKIYSTVLYFVF
jgi:hypothetical protein